MSMRVPFGDQTRLPDMINQEMRAAFDRVMQSGRYILGEECVAFEKEFAAFTESAYCVGVASGTDALQLALMDAGIGAGDEVMTVANTAVPTATAISSVGASPVFVDIEEHTWEMNSALLESVWTPQTKAIIAVHLYGHPVDMDPVLAFAKAHSCVVIEDCAQAHGARYKDRAVGSMGDYGCFSFYPTKNLGAVGDAGAVVVQDQKTCERLRSLRNYGQSERYYHDQKGMNSRLDELQAALLRVKLPYLNGWNQQRRILVEAYQNNLASTEVQLQAEQDWATPVSHLFPIRSAYREQLMAYLEVNGIVSLIHYPIPIPAQKSYLECVGQLDSLPQSIALAESIMSLPLFPGLTLEEVQYVCDVMACFDKDVVS